MATLWKKGEEVVKYIQDEVEMLFVLLHAGITALCMLVPYPANVTQTFSSSSSCSSSYIQLTGKVMEVVGL